MRRGSCSQSLSLDFGLGMNKGVGPDPEPFSVAGGSGAVPPCSYLKAIPRQNQIEEAAEGGGRARPSTLPTADQEIDYSDQYEIGSDGKIRFKNTAYLTVNVTEAHKISIHALRREFPHLKILWLNNHPNSGEEISIYKIDVNKGGI